MGAPKGEGSGFQQRVPQLGRTSYAHTHTGIGCAAAVARARASYTGRVRGVLVLAGAARRELERGGGARAGRLLGRSVGLGFAVALAILAFAGARDVLQHVVVAALGWLTWIGGG